MAKSVTKAQSTSVGGFAYALGVQPYPTRLPVSYDTYRTIRKHPTVRLGRAMLLAPICAGQWTVETDDDVDDTVVELIQTEVVDRRDAILPPALRARCDFGWASFEIVYRVREGHISVAKYKPLLADLTTILVEPNTGDFAGFRQGQIDVPPEQSLLVTSELEGCEWYGTSTLEAIRSTYNDWVAANEAAARYDRRVAGAATVVRYPRGMTIQADGTEKDNSTIANEIATAISGGGRIVLPQPLEESIREVGEQGARYVGWLIEFLGDGNPKQYSFVPRLGYLDKLLLRGLLLPERTLTEGQFGTKAEAGVHVEFAMVQLQETHRTVTAEINTQVVDRLVGLNFGPDVVGKVKLVAAPLVDAEREWLRSLYTNIVKQPSGFLTAMESLDFDAIMDSLGLPKRQEVVQPVSVPPGMTPGDDTGDTTTTKRGSDTAKDGGTSKAGNDTVGEVYESK